MRTELLRTIRTGFVAKIKALLSHDYLRDVFTLMLGAGIAQLIPALISPILTRLYTPYDFGVYTVFISIAYIVSPIVCGCYDQAIILVDSRDELTKVVCLSGLVALIVSGLFLISQIIFKNEFAYLLKNSPMGGWFYWLPLVVFMAGIFNVLNYLLTYQKKFKAISRINVFRAGFASFFQVMFGLLKVGPVGLFSSQIGSFVVVNFMFIKVVRPLVEGFLAKKQRLAALWVTAKRYKDFPKYSSSATLLNTFSFNAVNIFVGIVYSAHIVGMMALVTQIIGLPIALIASSFSRVFLQRASEERKKTGLAKDSFIFTFKNLLVISFIVFVFLLLFVTPLVSFVFGSRWVAAASYVKILIPFFSIRFISSVLSVVATVFERQKLLLIVNIGIFLLIMLSFFIGWHFHMLFEHFLLIYSLALAAWYLAGILFYYKVACVNSD